MTQNEFDARLKQLLGDYEELVTRPNELEDRSNGVLQRCNECGFRVRMDRAGRRHMDLLRIE